MQRRLRGRLESWSEERAPPLHTFLTKDTPGYHWARTIVGFALVIGLGAALLWGLTGQEVGEPPVVVIESGSMMHCEQGPGTASSICGSTSWGRLGTIDPGDLVFVRDVDGREDVDTMAVGGKDRHGFAGDVVVYARADGPPIIHRAMFWVDVHGDGTYNIPELGIFGADSFNRPELMDMARWGLRDAHSCLIKIDKGRESHGFVTKGDNNDCWDQGSVLPGVGTPSLVTPDQIVGKARGEMPWIGLLKLFVFQLMGGQPLYAAAPADLKRAMWITVGALIVVPYGYEWWIKKRREESEEMAAEAAADDAPGTDE